ncbi:uncharacterized protein [Miscanthus floridulus]|uniref:uncharacterized protein n=1 Tax=Miscanthus floridulus TaxID=154761 RepID=UPI00345883F4
MGQRKLRHVDVEPGDLGIDDDVSDRSSSVPAAAEGPLLRLRGHRDRGRHPHLQVRQLQGGRRAAAQVRVLARPAPAAAALAQAAGPARDRRWVGRQDDARGQIEDRFYIYLEYVHPGSINKYVKQHYGAMTEPVIRNFTRHILRRLAFLHGQKIMHRDIKGANLLVDVQGVVKLADFGMAKHLSTAAPNLSLKGTPYWMAPEVS